MPSEVKLPDSKEWAEKVCNEWYDNCNKFADDFYMQDYLTPRVAQLMRETLRAAAQRFRNVGGNISEASAKMLERMAEEIR